MHDGQRCPTDCKDGGAWTAPRNAGLSIAAVAAPFLPCCGVRDDLVKVHRNVNQVSKLMRSIGAEPRGCARRYTCDGECEPYACGEMSW